MKKKSFQVTTYDDIWFYPDNTPILYSQWDGRRSIINTSEFVTKKEAYKLVDRIFSEFLVVNEVLVLDWSEYSKDNNFVREISFVRRL